MRSVEFQRGYDTGYKQALLDAIRRGGPPTEPELVSPRPRPPFHPGGAGVRMLKRRLGVDDG
jgi:hypothetical protein